MWASCENVLQTLTCNLVPADKNLLANFLQGCYLVTGNFFFAYNSLLWLKQQIVHGGAIQWLEQNQPPVDLNQHNGPVSASEVRSVYVARENLLNTRA